MTIKKTHPQEVRIINRKIESGMVFKNYKELCNYLEEPVKAGKSKQLQIKDWERHFMYSKSGNKFIITKVYDSPVKKVDRRGGNHNKNVEVMNKYIKSASFSVGDFYSFTTWFCDELKLLNKDICSVIYRGSEEISRYCEKNNVSNCRLMYKYVSVAKSELKKMFLAALKHMGKKNLIAYKIGYKFFYEISDKSMGYVSTDQLNDTIINNENSICNSLNQKYKFSDKLHDRQNLLLIYGNQSYHREFEDEKIKRLMKDDISIKKLNKEIEVSYGKYSCKIDDQHPIISYFQSVMIMMSKIDDDDFNDTDNIILLKSEIRGLIKEKVRKTIRQYHYTDKVHNEIVYPFVSDSCERDMNIVEDLLFSSNSICNINNDQNQEEKEKVMNHKVIDGFHYIEDCWTEEELRHLPFLQPLSTQSFSHAI